jgi:hypothetical protein
MLSNKYFKPYETDRLELLCGKQGLDVSGADFESTKLLRTYNGSSYIRLISGSGENRSVGVIFTDFANIISKAL